MVDNMFNVTANVNSVVDLMIEIICLDTIKPVLSERIVIFKMNYKMNGFGNSGSENKNMNQYVNIIQMIAKKKKW